MLYMKASDFFLKAVAVIREICKLLIATKFSNRTDRMQVSGMNRFFVRKCSPTYVFVLQFTDHDFTFDVFNTSWFDITFIRDLSHKYNFLVESLSLSQSFVEKTPAPKRRRHDGETDNTDFSFSFTRSFKTDVVARLFSTSVLALKKYHEFIYLQICAALSLLSTLISVNTMTARAINPERINKNFCNSEPHFPLRNASCSTNLQIKYSHRHQYTRYRQFVIINQWTNLYRPAKVTD